MVPIVICRAAVIHSLLSAGSLLISRLSTPERQIFQPRARRSLPLFTRQTLSWKPPVRPWECTAPLSAISSLRARKRPYITTRRYRKSCRADRTIALLLVGVSSNRTSATCALLPREPGRSPRRAYLLAAVLRFLAP